MVSRVSRGPSIHPLLGCRVASALENTQFEVRLNSSSPAYLADHVVQGSAIFPAAAYIEQGMAAANQVFGPGNHRIENLSIQQAMFLSEDSSRTVQVIVSPESNGQCTFQVFSTSNDSAASDDEVRQSWSLHAWGQIRRGKEIAAEHVDIDRLKASSTNAIESADFYRLVSKRGLSYGPSFQVLQQLHRCKSKLLAGVSITEAIKGRCEQYLLHPTLIDGCLQAMAGVVGSEDSLSEYTYLPTGVSSIEVSDNWQDERLSELVVVVERCDVDDTPDPNVVEADIRLVNAKGEVLVKLAGVCVQRLGRPGESKAESKDWLYQLNWQREPLEVNGAEDQETSSVINESLSGNWILLAHRAETVEPLAARLRQQGARCIVVELSDEYRSSADMSSEDSYRIDPLNSEHFKRLCAESLGDALECRAVVQVWTSDEGQQACASSICSSQLQRIQQLARFTGKRPPQLWTLTHSAQWVGDSQSAISPAQSAVWGIVRVAMNEHPELGCRLVDLDTSVQDAAATLVEEFASNTEEQQIAIRGNERFVARLTAKPELASTPKSNLGVPPSGAYRVRLGDAGSIDGLRFESFKRVAPEADQVEIEVRSAGLNFSDVLKAMGLYPGIKDKIVPLGIECAGVVSAVGSDVTRFNVGDAVMGIAPHSFATHARTAEFALVHKPDSMSDADAATVPITFLTAYHALCKLAHLSAGEKVLIHAGAGGVGLAAIQIAKHVGAEIYATAGSDEKRDFLRSLGVAHVSNSRSLEFGEEILSRTDRRGVDVVLNSLPGDAITESFRVLAAYGRFLEIGKTDIYQNRMIGLAPFQDNLSYHAVDLDRMFRQRPDYMQTLFQDLVKHFDNGDLEPIASTVFPISDIVGSFRYMAQRRNIGKVVVSLSHNEAECTQETDVASGTRLITGGLGALGLRVAAWIARTDQQPHIALLSRREPSPEAREQIETIEATGARIVVLQGDVACKDSLSSAIAKLPNEFPPLSGVVHAAGVLDDGLLLDLDQQRLDRVLAPKVKGAWNLHEATLELPLDYFIMFSSVACVLGSPGQANYAAGNAYMDGLAAYRNARDLPALSVNWGPWANAGMAADQVMVKQLSERGMGMLPEEECFELLDGFVSGNSSALSHAVVADVDWRKMAKQFRSNVPAMLQSVVTTDDGIGAEDATDVAFRNELLALSSEERELRLQKFLCHELASIMGLEVGELDVNRPLNEAGLDSLMAIELKNNMESRLAITVPVSRFMDGPSIVDLCSVAAELVSGESKTPAMETSSDQAELLSASTTETRYPLSHGQRALWFIQQMAPDSTAYHVSDAMRVIGDFNLDHVRTALQALVDRHAAFRTTFHQHDGQPYQIVLASMEAPLEVIDATDWNEDETQQRAVNASNKPFDLETGPLIRLIAFRQSDERHLLVWVVHHIVADLVSLVTSTMELKKFYAAALVGESPSLPAPEIEFVDFVQHEHEMLNSNEGERHLQYWQDQLGGELPVLDIVTDRPRPAVQTFRGALLYHSLSQELTDKILALGERHQATLNMVLLAAYELLMARYSGQDDILVGMPATGRSRSDVSQVVGYFVNPVVVRADVSANPTVASFLGQIREKMIGALEHQMYPFPLLVEKLTPQRDPSRSPVFQTMFAMWRFHKASQQGFAPFMAGERDVSADVFGLQFEPAGLEQRTAMFDLSLTASDADESGVTLAMQYNLDLFDEATVQQMLYSYEHLLSAMVANDQACVGELEMLDQSQQETLIQWGDGGKAFPADDCLHELFERCVDLDAQAIAVIAGEETLTYGELNSRANQVAHYLRSIGVEPESTVAISLPRGANTIVAMLATLKAGGVYVPVDPDLPAERKRLIAEDADIGYVFSCNEFDSDCWTLPNSHVIDFASPPGEMAICKKSNPDAVALPTNCAYLIYTSGSTGRPKAVQVEHRSVVNYVQCAGNQFELSPKDRVLQFASISFDHSVEEIFPTLLCGAALVIRDDSISLLARPFLAACEALGVTVLDLPTAFWRQLTHEIAADQLAIPKSVRLLVTGGESATVRQVASWQKLAGDDVRFVSNYGPTEATVVATAWEASEPVKGNGVIPIGRPVAGVMARVMDRSGRLVAPGAAGELCLGGAGIARGYLNQAELTKQKFVDNALGSGDRLYRTGDKVRWNRNGELEFLGRIDQQIKLRGFRVELGEIESALIALDSVEDAIVLAPQINGSTRLTAFVIPALDEVDIGSLREKIDQSLPSYMVPTAFVTLDRFPRNKSDKVDRSILASMASESKLPSASYVAPRSPIEMQLAGIWIETLGTDAIGVRDNFFDLGGHSLLAVQLISRVNRQFDFDLPLSSLLQDGTIERMAALIKQYQANDESSPLVPIRPEGHLPPVFCIHPAGGNVLCYYELAHALEDERPVIAVQSRGVDGRSAPYVTMKEMVADYIEAIRAHQPIGPYHIAGWSSGGVVAYEVARILKENGDRVDGVHLIDSRVMSSIDLIDPNDESQILITLADSVERFYGIEINASYEELASLDSDQRIEWMIQRSSIAGQSVMDFDVDYLNNFVQIARANLRAMRDYIPPPSDLSVNLYRAAERAGELDEDLSDDLGWRDIVGERLQVHESPGDHISMMTGDHVGVLAKTLSTQLLSTSQNVKAVKSIDLDASESQLRPFYEDVQAHYDRSNAFYQLFLDRTMTYSCAYFQQDDLTLEEAQLAKIDLSLSKCRLKPGMHLLDVGCGWGATVMRAVETLGVSATGLTLSKNQHAYASSLTKNRSEANFLLKGWEEFDEPVDRIVSIGALEHFRMERYAAFFGRCRELLPDDGWMMIHSIIRGNQDTLQPGQSNVDAGLIEYARMLGTDIFPGGQLPPREVVVHRAEAEGFALHRMQSLRPHYARTLDKWADSLQANRERAIELTSLANYDLYVRYLTSSAHYFRTGHLDLIQFTFRVN